MSNACSPTSSPPRAPTPRENRSRRRSRRRTIRVSLAHRCSRTLRNRSIASSRPPRSARMRACAALYARRIARWPGFCRACWSREDGWSSRRGHGAVAASCRCGPVGRRTCAAKCACIQSARRGRRILASTSNRPRATSGHAISRGDSPSSRGGFLIGTRSATRRPSRCRAQPRVSRRSLLASARVNPRVFDHSRFVT